MWNRFTLIGGLALLWSCALLAADPAYVGTWKVNEEKSDRGIAMTFVPADAGDLRMLEGGRDTLVRFDGKDYPHPLGGVVRWTRIDDRTWETRYSKDGRVLGNATYQLSPDGQTLTRRSKGDQNPVVYRRRTGEPRGLAGAWSFTQGGTVSTMTIGVAEGYDLVIEDGGAKCKANFDGRDYPVIGPNGKASTSEACRIAKAGANGFSMTILVNGKLASTSTYTASQDGKTLTQSGDPAGKPPIVVRDRQ
jgi:hypothetical protein